MKLLSNVALSIEALVAMCVVSVLLVACGGGGGGGGSGATGSNVSTQTSFDVTPMKGQFCVGAQVIAYDSNNVKIGVGAVNEKGVATITVSSSISTPLHLTVGAGNTDSCYWDESTSSYVTIPAQAITLNAMVPTLQTATSGVGVTLFTELAYQKATSGVSVNMVSASMVQAVNKSVADAFGLPSIGVTDILTAPTLIGKDTGKISSLNDVHNAYAVAVAAMAKLSNNIAPNTAPKKIVSQLLDSANANATKGFADLPEMQTWESAWRSTTLGTTTVLSSTIVPPDVPKLSTSSLIGPTIEFKKINAYFANNGINQNFTISGWYSSPTNQASGSGSFIVNAASQTVRNGATVLQQTHNIHGQLVVKNVTKSLDKSSVQFLNATTYAELESIAQDEYSVFSDFTYPSSIRPGSRGTLSNITVYSDTSKNKVLQTEQFTYEVLPESDSTIVLSLIYDGYNASNAHIYQERDNFRVKLDGTAMPLSTQIITYEASDDGLSDIKLTFDSAKTTPGTWGATSLISDDIYPQFGGAELASDSSGNTLMAVPAYIGDSQLLIGYQKSINGIWGAQFSIAPSFVPKTKGSTYLNSYRDVKLGSDNVGNAIAAWVYFDHTAVNDRGFISHVYVRNKNNATWGEPKIMQSNPSEYASKPHLFMQPDGVAWLVWTERVKKSFDFSTQDAFAIFAAKYIPATGWGMPEKISGDISSEFDYFASKLRAQVATDAAGNPTVVWSNNYAIYVTRKLENVWSAAEKIVDYGADPIHYTENFSLAVDSKQNAIVAWESQDVETKTNTTIYSRRYEKASGWQGIKNMPLVKGQESKNFYLSMDKKGNAFLLWNQFDGNFAIGVWGARFESESGWQIPTLISKQGGFEDCSSVRIGFDAQGNGIAIWRRYDASLNGTILRARRYNIKTGWESETTLSTKPTVFSSFNSLSVSEDGHATALWVQDDVGNQSLRMWASTFVP